MQADPRPNLADADPNWYLQTVSGFALTVEGQDRARGRMVVQPLPDPAEDDGRKLSNLILKEVAAAITVEYAPDKEAEFLAEEGIPPRELALPNGVAAGDAHEILAAVWRWGSTSPRPNPRSCGAERVTRRGSSERRARTALSSRAGRAP